MDVAVGISKSLLLTFLLLSLIPFKHFPLFINTLTMFGSYWAQRNCPPTPMSPGFSCDEASGVVLSPVFEHNGSPWTIARVPLNKKEIKLDFTAECGPRVTVKQPECSPKSKCNCGCSDGKKDEEIRNERLELYKWHLLSHESNPNCPWCPFC